MDGTDPCTERSPDHGLGWNVRRRNNWSIFFFHEHVTATCAPTDNRELYDGLLGWRSVAKMPNHVLLIKWHSNAFRADCAQLLRKEVSQLDGLAAKVLRNSHSGPWN